ncbi:hypothetical protein J416_11512 [Gracilibacillus halophilus YIM-C55.5]|uniref:Calcineurin-like phosphoesterase domain-containing protein n=1 Tax=Gracilibacillus halophilus YIM-C55.5 TaxID=1308866 RepID=N4WAJ9_9BACI|nr:DNA repair exonuclease [Gracilibacillus halophilus]ENH96299.1 hypothetical protein J416_11512 [Gracilibacillus halophilus YIM-C55.5]
MNRKISFLHCADLHLDSPFQGLRYLPENLFDQVRNSTFQALENLVALAIDKQVDFIVIAGDIFDQEEQSMKAHMALIRAFRTLQKHHINVYLSFGNHDYINSQTFPRNYPENVFVFENAEVESFDFYKHDQPLATIYGFSYEDRAVEQNMIPQYQPHHRTRYHIAMLHGSPGNLQSTDHAVYAPFQLHDLKRAGFDYWALGHIHKREILSEEPPIVYSGNIQGRSVKELGERGCYYVTLSDHQCQFEFYPLQAIRFENITMDASDWKDITEATEILDKRLHEEKHQKGNCFVTIELINGSKLLKQWQEQGYMNEMVDILNQQQSESDPWVQIISIRLQEYEPIQEWTQGEHFLQTLRNAFDHNDFAKITAPLMNHTQARKHLYPFYPNEKEELWEEAKKQVEQMLHQKEG